ncbi:MAG: hypothetical protein GC199_08545 [Alphaproteobacteria bacterium]|nr:hypothetical protein [Alphaproteobacteria bacterium]
MTDRWTVATLPGGFPAAEISNLDVARDAADAATGARLRSLLAEYGVLCVRQTAPLDDAGLRALVQMIGPIKTPLARARDGGMLPYSDERQIIDAGFVLTAELRQQLGDLSFGGDDLRPGLFQFFHTDDSYTEQPAEATVLHARELPNGPGGDTEFIDMRAAFAALAPAEQARLIGLRAVHAYNNRGAFPPRPPAKGPLEALVDVAHPVVRRHSVTGRAALYFDLDRATHIEGLSEAEGRALLQSLQTRAEETAPRYSHRWRAHDVLVWDNVSVQHRARGDFPVGEPRRFWRYMVAGEVPEAFGA